MNATLQDQENRLGKSLEATNAELLPCPFCGRKAGMQEMRYCNTGGLYGYALECEGCGLSRERQPACWTNGQWEAAMRGAMVELADWWNTRAGPAGRDVLGGAESKGETIMKLIKLPNGEYVAPDNVGAIRKGQAMDCAMSGHHPARVILDLRTGSVIVIEAEPGEELQALADRVADALGEGERS